MHRRFGELREAGTRGSAAGVENRRSHRYRDRTGEKFLPALAGESERGRGCDSGGQILPAAVPGGCLFPRCLADAALAGRGLFHIGTHGVQVVGSRDYRKQQNHCAAKSAEEHERARRVTFCWTIRTGRRRRPPPPQQVGGHQQRKPTEIKKKLHSKCPGLLPGTSY